MKVLSFGEIMLRLTPPGNKRLTQALSFDIEYGGSESNVAISLAQFGIDSQYITRLPENELGQAALYALARYKVGIDACIRGGDRLGIYFLEMGAGKRSSKVTYDRAHSGMATLAPGMIDWAKACAGAGWFHWSGITPGISRSAAEATVEAIQSADKQGLTISCDLNYRSALWKYGSAPRDIMPQMVEHCSVLQGDPSAFELYFDIRAQDPHELLAAVQARFPRLRYLTMSSRQGLSASHNVYRGYLHTEGQTLVSQEHSLPDILDRIGSGDAFMAGLIYGIVQGKAPEQTLEFAAAAAAWKHYVHGDINLASIAEIEALAAGNTGGRVLR
ncbi:MAG: sugar kinase [Bacteroidetes bacterium]|nr:MAG: sugar kinase [Bacteroidota bacterium]